MDNLFLAATPSSPEVDFRFEENLFSLRGESYPENAAAFYAPLLARLKEHLGSCKGASIVVNVALAYFNSSSTKMLFGFFGALDQAAATGNQVVLNWYRDVEDETIQEFGEDLVTDFPNLEFHDHAMATS